MLKINERNRVYGEDIHQAIESKLNNYSLWVSRMIEYADLKEEKDFFTILLKSTGGRPKIQYEFTLDSAKEICLLERNEKGKEIRRWLIEMSSQRQSLELITVKEAVFATRVVNCLKYVSNQKECLQAHQESFIEENEGKIGKKFIYAEFAKYRAKIVGWDKEKTDKAITEYLDQHSGYNRNKVMQKDMSTKHSIMDIGEAIRIAVLDILYSNHEDSEMAHKFSELCKRFANEMQIQAEKSNQKNLFRDQENIDHVKSISLK